MGTSTQVQPPRAEFAVEFDAIYRAAGADPTLVPWCRQHAHPTLVSWLNAEAPSLTRPGARVVVVGCGLGDDVSELADRGFDPIGIDVSPAAIEWAQRRHGAMADRFLVADLFDLPSRFHGRFDLVVEIFTLQALDPSLRESAAARIASLVSSHGTVLLISYGRDEGKLIIEGPPPWPLTLGEFSGLMEAQGLFPTRDVDDFKNEDGRRLFRAAFHRR